MEHTTIAVDLAKSVFQVAVSHRPGRVDEEHRLTRARVLRFFAERPAATVLLEACGSAHHWGRELERLGHTVQSDTPGKAGGLMSGAASKAVALVVTPRGTRGGPGSRSVPVRRQRPVSECTS